MKPGTKIRITEPYDGTQYKKDDIGVYIDISFFTIGEDVVDLFPSEYEIIQEKSTLDQIKEEMDTYKNINNKDIGFRFWGNTDTCRFILGNSESLDYPFINYENALKWLKEQNKPKEKTINIEGKDFTLDQLKKLISEAEKWKYYYHGFSLHL